MTNFNFHDVTVKGLMSVLLSIFIFFANSQTVTTVAGGAGGFSDGTISKVKFNSPWGIVADTFGNIYIADHGNNRIRKISTTGIVSTFAGNGIGGYADGVGICAAFKGPNLLAIDVDNNIYVADQGNNRIRKITLAGVVTTLAGNGNIGNVDGPVANAEFNNPSGIAIDVQKNVYVADQYNNVIRKISASGIVTTLAGGIQGYMDGAGFNARFNGPNGITVDSQGNVFVAEVGNNRIRKITPAGIVTTFAGNGVAGYQDGVGVNAQFNIPIGLTIDAQNSIYVADYDNARIRKITSTQVVTTVAGNTTGFMDGVAANAKFRSPFGLAIDKANNLYTADAANNSIRKIILTGYVSTVAGNGLAGYIDGLADNPELYGPNSVAADTKGNLYVAETSNNRIRKITPNGVITTIAGNGTAGFINGQGSFAQFNESNGIVLDAQNNIYVADALNHCVRKIDTAGLVTTFAGNGTAGFADGTGTNARLNHPNRLAIDQSGYIYVADVLNYRIRKISPFGVVTTIAGNGTAGFADGIASNAKFNYPNGVAIDNSGNVYIADYNNNRIRKISASGIVSTFAGNGNQGYVNGNAANAEFNHPSGIVINASGDFYVAEESGNRIRKITAAGNVSLWAGNGVSGLIDGIAVNAEFYAPRGIGVDTAGNVYVPDLNNNKIRKITIGSDTVGEYYRSVGDGNWNNTSTWESSADSIAWHVATGTPDNNAKATVVRSGHTVIVTADVAVHDLKVNTGGYLITASCVTLTVR